MANETPQQWFALAFAKAAEGVIDAVVRESCLGCVHNSLGQRNHDVCLQMSRETFLYIYFGRIAQVVPRNDVSVRAVTNFAVTSGVKNFKLVVVCR